MLSALRCECTETGEPLQCKKESHFPKKNTHLAVADKLVLVNPY